MKSLLKFSLPVVALAIYSSSVFPATLIKSSNNLCGNSLFGDRVCVFSASDSMSDIQQSVNTVYNAQKDDQFGSNGYALLFLPGATGSVATYPVDVQVGFYTQVLGLGANSQDVKIRTVQDSHLIGNQSTQEFWRGAENLTIDGGYSQDTGQYYDTWAVSQAAPLRRVDMSASNRNLILSLGDNHYASGGFIADSQLNVLKPVGQQQWITQDSSIAKWDGAGVWNMVFVGDLGQIPAPVGPQPSNQLSTWSDFPNTNVPASSSTPNAPTAAKIDPKPFLVYENGQYGVVVPTTTNPAPSPISISQFYIVKSGSTLKEINEALNQGKNLIITPGTYQFGGTINITHANTIVLGLGVPALVSSANQPVMTVKTGIGGVKVGGIIFDAGSVVDLASAPDNLLEIGTGKDSSTDNEASSYLYDVYCRVGGRDNFPNAKVKACLTVNNNNVIGDNLWLWRADHGAGVSMAENAANNGLIVNGNHVTMYGLAVEHFEQYQTLWNGDNGKLYFYQSELPYRATATWKDPYGNAGYPSIKLSDTADHFDGYGIGIYTYFESANIMANSAIEAPNYNTIHLTHLVTRFLNGLTGTSPSGLAHMIAIDNSAGVPGTYVGDAAVGNQGGDHMTAKFGFWVGANNPPAPPVTNQLTIQNNSVETKQISASINWTVHSDHYPISGIKSSVVVDGQPTPFNCSTVSTTNDSVCQVNVAGLIPGHQYSYDISASDSVSTAVDASGTFTTGSPVTNLKIEDNKATTTDRSATVSWTIASNNPLTSLTSAVNVNGVAHACAPHISSTNPNEAVCEVMINSLNPVTTYEYGISATDAQHHSARLLGGMFKTANSGSSSYAYTFTEGSPFSPNVSINGINFETGGRSFYISLSGIQAGAPVTIANDKATCYYLVGNQGVLTKVSGSGALCQSVVMQKNDVSMKHLYYALAGN